MICVEEDKQFCLSSFFVVIDIFRINEYNIFWKLLSQR